MATNHIDTMSPVEMTTQESTMHLSNSNDEGSPMITAALEALLGEATPPSTDKDNPADDAADPEATIAQNKVDAESLVELESTDVLHTELNGPSTSPTNISSSQAVFNAEEAIRPGDMIPLITEIVDTQQPEFEVDSSPYESSSDDSSDDSSSSDDDNDNDAYKLLSPEEQARILMEGDGGSDDEGGGNKGAKGSGAQLRTKNEIPEEVIPKPDVTITPTMKIELLGEVELIVENVALIKAKTSGEYRVLETGSVLCLEDRIVIGVVADTLGRVQQPLYSVRFTNSEDIVKAGLAIGTRIFYSEQHSTYVFTQALKAYKGSDASNLHDEEVGDEEVEFSDDEAEAEHKRRLKQKKLERRGGGDRGGRPNGNATGRGGHPRPQQQTPYDPALGLSYDDEDDGPYKPLARPPGYGHTVGRTEAPQEGVYAGGIESQPREPYGRGRGDRGRGRGDRGRSNDRGRERGGFQDRRVSRDEGFTQRPYANGNQGGYTQPPRSSPMAQGPSFAQNFPQNFSPNFNFNQQPQQYSPQQQFAPPFPPVPYFPPQPYQQAYSQTPQMWPHAAPAIPTGAYFNPAFFGNQQQQGPPQSWTPPAQQPQNANDARDRLDLSKILKNLGSGGGGAGT